MKQCKLQCQCGAEDKRRARPEAIEGTCLGENLGDAVIVHHLNLRDIPMGQARKIIVNSGDLGTTRVSKSLPGNYPGWPPSPVSQEGAVVRWLRDNVFAQDRQREVAGKAENGKSAHRVAHCGEVERPALADHLAARRRNIAQDGFCALWTLLHGLAERREQPWRLANPCDAGNAWLLLNALGIEAADRAGGATRTCRT